MGNLYRPGRNLWQPARGSQRPLWPFTINPSSPQANGLVAWYPMMPFIDAYDIGPSGRFLATNNGGLVWVADEEMGSVPLFDDASLQFFKSSIPPVTAMPLTISAWFLDDDGSLADRNIVQIQDSGASNQFFRLGRRGTGENSIVGIASGNGAFGQATTTNTFTVNTWNLAVVVFFTATDRQVWLNADDANRGTDTANHTPSGLNSMDIGREGDSDPADHWSGHIIDVRIYNRALTFPEIRHLFDASTRWDLYYPLRQVIQPFVKPLEVPTGGSGNSPIFRVKRSPWGYM